MDDVITLISEKQYDDEGNVKEDQKERDVFCSVENISSNEFYKAGQKGLDAKYKFKTFKGNYNGEERLIYKGKTYAVYRVYEDDEDNIELYAAEKAGVTYV